MHRTAVALPAVTQRRYVEWRLISASRAPKAVSLRVMRTVHKTASPISIRDRFTNDPAQTEFLREKSRVGAEIIIFGGMALWTVPPGIGAKRKWEEGRKNVRRRE